MESDVIVGMDSDECVSCQLSQLRLKRFEWFRATFRLKYHDDICLALGRTVNLSSAPLSVAVRLRFMLALERVRSASSQESLDVRPTLHGTRADLDSIFQRGLLIPGKGNDLQVVNGSKHGLGIYTANLDAAWLSMGFCAKEEPKMLVCAVLQTEAVTHPGDAQVIVDEAHVVPLFVAKNLEIGPKGMLQRPMPISAYTLCSSSIAELLGVGFTRHGVLCAGYPAGDWMREFTTSELLEHGYGAQDGGVQDKTILGSLDGLGDYLSAHSTCVEFIDESLFLDIIGLGEAVEPLLLKWLDGVQQPMSPRAFRILSLLRKHTASDQIRSVVVGIYLTCVADLCGCLDEATQQMQTASRKQKLHFCEDRHELAQRYEGEYKELQQKRSVIREALTEIKSSTRDRDVRRKIANALR